MIVTIVTFNLPEPTTLRDITKVFQGTAPKYQGIPGLLRKNYWMSEDGRRAGGIYVWASRVDAERVYTPEWKKFVEGKYGSPPIIEYLHSPVMVDNREGTISVAAKSASGTKRTYQSRRAICWRVIQTWSGPSAMSASPDCCGTTGFAQPPS